MGGQVYLRRLLRTAAVHLRGDEMWRQCRAALAANAATHASGVSAGGGGAGKTAKANGPSVAEAAVTAATTAAAAVAAAAAAVQEQVVSSSGPASLSSPPSVSSRHRLSLSCHRHQVVSSPGSHAVSPPARGLRATVAAPTSSCVLGPTLSPPLPEGWSASEFFEHCSVTPLQL